MCQNFALRPLHAFLHTLQGSAFRASAIREQEIETCCVVHLHVLFCTRQICLDPFEHVDRFYTRERCHSSAVYGEAKVLRQTLIWWRKHSQKRSTLCSIFWPRGQCCAVAEIFCECWQCLIFAQFGPRSWHLLLLGPVSHRTRCALCCQPVDAARRSLMWSRGTRDALGVVPALTDGASEAL